MKRCLLPVFLLLLFAACTTTTPSSTPSLAAFIDEATSAPPFDRALWGIVIEDDDGTVLYAQNAHKLFMPASNRKLFAAATVANCLGFAARLETEVWRDGEDLIVRGDGDPSLGSWRYERDGDFDALAADLRARGILQVRDVIADVSAFDRVTIPGGWKYGNLGSDYAAPVDALAWNENAVPVSRAVDDPALVTATQLRDALLFHGIAVTGVPRVVVAPRAWGERIAIIPSPFVAQLLSTVLKNSQNLYAEMLFKRATDGTYPASFATEAAFATAEAGVPADELRFVDGCGLAPDDLVTPAAIVRMLRWMNDPARRGMWWSILAQPSNEGTLRRRVVTLTDRFRGKTGTINGVNALSGIVAMPNGRYRYVSVIVNHHNADGASAILDGIVERAAQ
jgi:D-alanyl-D-alanine carboxypeptidase/D-alanyl-D-alanine-endopeptidase (penicillin-binding protein 4)